MTPKQAERLKNKIKKIKKDLAADKKFHGGYYDDSHGRRYLPPEFYLKLQDYTGALRYFNWFSKNFPDDMGFPIFLFEWTVTLFKTKRRKAAEKKALQTFFANTYLLDHFLHKKRHELDIREGSNWENYSLVYDFHYSKDQADLRDFADWLEDFFTSATYKRYTEEFIEINQKLKTESIEEVRSSLVYKMMHLLDDFEAV